MHGTCIYVGIHNEGINDVIVYHPNDAGTMGRTISSQLRNDEVGFELATSRLRGYLRCASFVA